MSLLSNIFFIIVFGSAAVGFEYVFCWVFESDLFVSIRRNLVYFFTILLVLVIEDENQEYLSRKLGRFWSSAIALLLCVITIGAFTDSIYFGILGESIVGWAGEADSLEILIGCVAFLFFAGIYSLVSSVRGAEDSAKRETQTGSPASKAALAMGVLAYAKSSRHPKVPIVTPRDFDGVRNMSVNRLGGNKYRVTFQYWQGRSWRTYTTDITPRISGFNVGPMMIDIKWS
ncbi:hypothetical protein [Pseudohaliea rubra]|uniref:hypothetical protein n=1 Tax=Pseudohaliea rubra TaxID=475795 RepID=UPI001184B4E6|nr:hypothetical protein [Pseudohaliea rubra]